MSLHWATSPFSPYECMNKFITFCVIYCVLINPSHALELPRYWLCQGTSQQISTQDQMNIEQYKGNDPVLLEIFSNKVYQFFSPALAGAYVQCATNQDTLMFQREDCQAQTKQKYFRQGVLNLQTGQLIFSESRKIKSKDIRGTGQYQCQYLGNTYNFLPFNHAK